MRLASLVVVLIVVAGGNLPARGQATRGLATVKSQLARASELGRKVLAGLQETPTDSSGPLDETLVRNARETYVLIRAARSEMVEMKARQKGPDPVMDLAFQRVDAAWNLSRTPVDMTGLARPEYVRRSSEDVSRALQLLDQALVLMP